MKTLPISIHTKQISVLSSEYPLERTLMRFAVIFLAILVCAYIYFVTASVFHVMGREEALTEITHLSATTASLEQDFFNKTELLTHERGSELGLAPVRKTVYVQGVQPVVEASDVTTSGL